MKKTLITLLLVGGLAALLATVLTRPGEAGSTTPGVDRAIAETVTIRTLTDEMTIRGELRRAELQSISSSTDGRISGIGVEAGEVVAEGDALFSIDGRQTVAVTGHFAFYRQLDVGSDGHDVLQLETILEGAGYEVGDVDGLYTEETRSGLAAWQADHGYAGTTAEVNEVVTVSLQGNPAGYTVGAINAVSVRIGPAEGGTIGLQGGQAVAVMAMAALVVDAVSAANAPVPTISLSAMAVVVEEAGAHIAALPLVDHMVTTRLLARVGACDDDVLAGTTIVGLAIRPPQDGTARTVPSGAVARQVVALDGDALVLVDDVSREAAVEFMRQRGHIDCLIPRGGPSLIRSILENATVPYVIDGDGNCHVYVDAGADLAMAADILVNAKTQRPSVCNAAESLVVHADVAERFLPMAAAALDGVEMVGDERARLAVPAMGVAVDEDWSTEYLDLKISVRVVDDLGEAIAHINATGSGHSEAIVTTDEVAAARFTSEVDAAAVLVNASTRFVDGEEFGFGAEIGISTQKLHARGPMGLEQLTTQKYVVRGDGHIRA